MKMRRNMLGVTLMELMIVVVIIGILAAVGYPNYRDFAARAKRTEAKSALLQIATNQERHYLQFNQYSSDMTDLGFAVDPYVTDSDSYSVTVTGADASNFTAVATFRLGGREADKCEFIRIDGRGSKTSDPYDNCWTDAR
jgi:type IV pilus assembly protein PilE